MYRGATRASRLGNGLGEGPASPGKALQRPRGPQEIDCKRWPGTTTRSWLSSASSRSSRSSRKDRRTRSASGPTRTRSRRSPPTGATSVPSPRSSSRRSAASGRARPRRSASSSREGRSRRSRSCDGSIPPELLELSRIPGVGPEDPAPSQERARRRQPRRPARRPGEQAHPGDPRPGGEGGGEPPARDRPDGRDGQGEAKADRGGDAHRPGVRGRPPVSPGSGGGPVLRQPPPAAGDRGRRGHRGGVQGAGVRARGLRDDADGARGPRERRHEDVGPDHHGPAGRPQGRRSETVRSRLPVLHGIEGPQHQAPATGARPRLAPERVRPEPRRVRER